MILAMVWTLAVLTLTAGAYWWTARPDRPYWDPAAIYHALGSLALIAVGIALTILASVQTVAR